MKKTPLFAYHNKKMSCQKLIPFIKHTQFTLSVDSKCCDNTKGDAKKTKRWRFPIMQNYATEFRDAAGISPRWKIASAEKPKIFTTTSYIIYRVRFLTAGFMKSFFPYHNGKRCVGVVKPRLMCARRWICSAFVCRLVKILNKGLFRDVWGVVFLSTSILFCWCVSDG